MNKTHWRKFHETEFLGAHDLQGLGKEEIVLKIKSANGANVKDQNGSSSNCLTMTFEGGAKPMIINTTNAKAVSKVVGSNFIEDWPGHHITVYIQKDVKAFGSVVDALRIRTTKPVLKSRNFDKEIKALQECETIDQLKDLWGKFDSQAKNKPEVLKVKEGLKEILS